MVGSYTQSTFLTQDSLQAHSVSSLLSRGKEKLLGDATSEEYEGDIDFINIALLIVGRSRHPFLQFLGDVISSSFDADKLDYLLRDATTAGLPLRYDFERYSYAVRIEDNKLADGAGRLSG